MISPQKRSTSSNASSCSTARLMRNSGPGDAPSFCSTCSLASEYRETVVSGTVTMTGLIVDISHKLRARYHLSSGDADGVGLGEFNRASSAPMCSRKSATSFFKEMFSLATSSVWLTALLSCVSF